MKKVIEYTQNKSDIPEQNNYNPHNIRRCPSCGMMSIKGMPGGRDSTCLNCGYKDPCCYD